MQTLEVVQAALKGMTKAQVEYETWSGGDWLWNGRPGLRAGQRGPACRSSTGRSRFGRHAWETAVQPRQFMPFPRSARRGCIVVAIASLPIWATAQELFREPAHTPPGIQPVTADFERSVLRTRTAILNLDHLSAAIAEREPLVLNPFPDARFEATIADVRSPSRRLRSFTRPWGAVAARRCS